MALHYIYIYSLGIILNYPDVWLNSATHHPGTSTAASTACRLPVQSLGVELNDRDRADERIAASHNSGSAVFRNDNAQNCGSKGQNLCCHQCTSQFAVNTRVLIGFWSNMNLFGRVPKLPTNLVVLAFCTCNYMYSYYIHFYLNIHIYIYHYIIMIMFHYIVTYIYIIVYTCMYILTNYNVDYIYIYILETHT